MEDNRGRVCKWCGREYDGRRSATGGWAVCSESCRQSLAASIGAGETEKNEGVSKIGCLVRLFILILIAGFVRNCYHSAKRTVAQTIQAEGTATHSGAKATLEEVSPPLEHSRPEPEAAEPITTVNEPVEEVVSEEAPAPTEPAPEPTTLSESETPLPPQTP